MKKTDKILLTGITGTVGSQISREALGRGLKIVALMRDKNKSAAKARVRAVLDIVGGREFENNVEIIQGDICQKWLGVKDGLEVFSDVSKIIHCAASTEFAERTEGLSHKVNVQGTANVLELASKLQIPVYYVSSAYIAGTREGIVKESELDAGQRFNNIYEQTKCQAEMLVNKWSRQTNLPVTIFRPSIVVGDSAQGKIVNFNGLYNLMRCFNTIAPIIGDEQIRAVANPLTTKNLIPVDYLAKAVWYIIDSGCPGTYHLTNPAPLKLPRLRDIFSELFSLGGIKIVTDDEFKISKPTKAELLYKKASATYQPYFLGEPIFDRSNTDKILAGSGLKIPTMDVNCFRRLLEYARLRKWGKVDYISIAVNEEFFTSAEKYFNDFLRKRKGKQLLPNLRMLSATFRIVLRERPELYWSLAIKNGVLTSISQNGMACECSFIVDTDAFHEITAGLLVPHQAFFQRRIDIEGDIETGLKLVTVLAEFFKKFPYDYKDEHIYAG